MGRCISAFKADEWGALHRNFSGNVPTKADIEAVPVADELLQDRIVRVIGDAVQEAIRDHKRAGNPIPEWRKGRVVLVPPEQIEN